MSNVFKKVFCRHALYETNPEKTNRPEIQQGLVKVVKHLVLTKMFLFSENNCESLCFPVHTETFQKINLKIDSREQRKSQICYFGNIFTF